ncbi:MAG TPA: ATP-dependent DNA helicase RecG [Methylococcus sp.]|nr:ATP-dependent DNA helicase RecG [Methylococcus sp.]
MDLDRAPLDILRGAGEKTIRRLRKLGIQKVADLLLHLPQRYEDRTCLTPLGALRIGQTALVEGVIELAEIAGKNRPILLCRISDGTGFLQLRFFHFSSEQRRQMDRDRRIRCFGEVRAGLWGREMIHPEYRLLDEGSVVPLETTLTPVYPSTEGVSQPTLRRLIQQALDLAVMGEQSEPELPAGLSLYLDGMSRREALSMLHRPSPECPPARLEMARRRLAFEELLAHQISVARSRQENRAFAAPRLEPDEALIGAFRKALPFSLTAAQLRVVDEIAADLARGFPMMRLLQGDVGSGKTVVAAHALLTAAANGWQTALMTPTEILAEQHFRTFSTWLEPLGLRVTLLTGRLKGQTRQGLLDEVTGGESVLVVGTHALFQDGVTFHRLGLVVIDEQHRFGVHQRLKLRDKALQEGWKPHQLVMTATPIPRTLAMLSYADLDLSVLDEIPPGRTPIETRIIPAPRRHEIIARIADWITRGRQAYWVCTLIEESERLQCEAAETTAASLAASLPGIRVGLIHGRMSSAEKDSRMQAFKAGAIDLLVATTVVEVGVDVPNAALMVIENAERLGLAQLHQLRGRVGRGPGEAYCLLLYQPPLNEIARKRLDILKKSNDGFAIAECDLKLRGPGEFLGVRQAGMPQFRVADLGRDGDLIEQVAPVAEILLRDHASVIEPIVRRWIGEASRLAHA